MTLIIQCKGLLIIICTIFFFNFEANSFVLKKKLKDVKSVALVEASFSMPDIEVATNLSERNIEVTNIVQGVISSKDVIFPRVLSVLSNELPGFVNPAKLFKIEEYYSMADPDFYGKTFPLSKYTIIKHNAKNCKKLCFILDTDLVVFLNIDYFIEPVYVPINTDRTNLSIDLSYLWSGLQLFFDARNSKGQHIFYFKVMEKSDEIKTREEYFSKGSLKQVYFSLHDELIDDLKKKIKKIFKNR